MVRRIAAIFLLACAVSAASPLACAALAIRGGDDPLYDIPKLDGIIVDGSGNDWQGRGFRIAVLPSSEGKLLPADDFDASCSLAWNERGLAVLVTVRDDMPYEHAEQLWLYDCVELYVGERVGSMNYYQLIVTSGADPDFGSMRSRIFDKRPEGEREPPLETIEASSPFEGGYRVEALLPWRNLGIDPRPGTELAFQITANDEDGDEGGVGLRVAWYPDTDTHGTPYKMRRILLADKPGPPVLFAVERVIRKDAAVVDVRGAKELVGTEVEIRTGGSVLERGPLRAIEGRAGIRFDIDPPRNGSPYPAMDIAAGDVVIASFAMIPTLATVIEHYIEALGGRAAIERLETRFGTGRIIHDLSSRTPPVHEVIEIEAYAKAPDRWFLFGRGENGTEQNGYDGTTGWKASGEKIERDDEMGTAKFASLFNPRGPLLLERYYPGMMLDGTGSVEGREVYIVRNDRPHAHYTLHFDIETGLLLRVGYYWDLLDYREVDGVKVPFTIVTSRKGGSTTWTFDRVEHNVPIDDVRFSPTRPIEDRSDPFAGIEDARVRPMLEHLPHQHGGMNIPPEDGRLLYDLIVGRGCRRGLEIGTSNGYSALWLGLAFRKTGGTIITIEIEELPAREAIENFKKADLDDVVDARIADAFEEIPRIEGEFDFVFIDAWKPDYLKFLRLVRNRMKPGGLITAHNVSSHGEDMRLFLEALETDPGLETTVHDTSPAGISVSVVKK